MLWNNTYNSSRIKKFTHWYLNVISNWKLNEENFLFKEIQKQTSVYLKLISRISINL